ncbi:MAG: hypothetical protein ACK58T_31880, partial [Phycisphaerae bacterium]
MHIGRGLDPTAPIVIDDEDRLGLMFENSTGTIAPTKKYQRDAAAGDLIELANCIRATSIGAQAAANGLGYYQGIIGASHPDNGGTWWIDWTSTNRIV